MPNLFDLFDDPVKRGPARPLEHDTWRPDPPPSLDQDQVIYLNVEATGLRWFANDRPLSVAVYARGRTYYLPWGHAGAGNLDEAIVKEWFRREVRGKHIININTRFDIHMLYTWGIDLEEQGNTVSDVGHYAALLDDQRLYMNLDSLVYDYLGENPMKRLDESKMASYPAGLAAPRAMYNVEVVKRLAEKLLPKLNAENLMPVKKLEDQVIYGVCEMERNGSPINVPLLEKWLVDVKKKYENSLMDIYRYTGLKVNPNSAGDIARVFKKYDIPILEYTAPSGKHPNGQPSFTDDVLKHEKHPAVKLVRQSKKYKSLQSKLHKYKDSIDGDGILRYALHQLRAATDETSDANESGTITGRFTSTEIVKGEGINIQQVLNPEKQFYSFGDEFFIRELHIPGPGMLYSSSDAEQIQYRLAANKAGNQKVFEAYDKDPWLSYHEMMFDHIKKRKPDMTYKRTKDTNFAKLFAAGPSKIGLMLEFISKKQFEELRRLRANRHHPLLEQVKVILDIYKKEFPEIDKMIAEASEQAKTQGYVTSLLGRRMRFQGERLHKALNMIIQSSEADIVKTKIVEVRKERKSLGLVLRSQVHDELNGDIPDEEMNKRLATILNHQSFPMRIPILWGSSTGNSWGDCARDKIAKLRKRRDEELAKQGVA
jgi:DNA polymerase-1